MTRAAAKPAPAPTMDDLALLLPDWRTHPRARNIAPSTVSSYFTVGDNLLRYLTDKGMPTAVSAMNREHLEAFLADLVTRVSPATVACTTARCSSCSGGSSRTARSPTHRWHARARRRSPSSRSTCSPTTSCAGCWPRAGAALSRTAGTAPCCACSSTPACAPRSCAVWPSTTSTTSTTSRASHTSWARADEDVLCRTGRRPPTRCAATGVPAPRTRRPRCPSCGSARKGRSPTPVCGRSSSAAPPMPGSRTSTRTASDTVRLRLLGPDAFGHEPADLDRVAAHLRFARGVVHDTVRQLAGVLERSEEQT